MNDHPKPLHIRTTVRAGAYAAQAQPLAERAMFTLLDALQKPTDWAYHAICPTPEKQA